MSFLDNSSHTELPWFPLFVYGTLRRGQENYTLLRGYTVSETPSYVDGLSLYALNAYPIAVPGPDSIIGELMTLNPKVYARLLNKLDEIEYNTGRAQGLLFRTTCTVLTATGPRTAWIYRARSADLSEQSRIKHGDWVRYQLDRITDTRLRHYLPTEHKKGL